MDKLKSRNDKEYFKLYSFNIPVKGKEKSAIYNLQRGKIEFIPNSMYEVLQLLEELPISKAITFIEKAFHSRFFEYLDYLKKEQFGFYTKEPERFPVMPLDWSLPSIIFNAEIEYSHSAYDIEDLFFQLNELLCKHIELRVKSVLELKEIMQVLKGLENHIFRSVKLYLIWTDSLDEKSLKSLLEKYKKISEIIVLNAPARKVLYIDNAPCSFFTQGYDTICLSPFPIDCYIINVEYFTEALQFNPYYNRKIAIDVKGNIKNALTCENIFGNIKEIRLADIIDREDFKSLWYASHDKIMKVKEMETRYGIMVTEPLTKVHQGYFSINEIEEELEQNPTHMNKSVSGSL